LPQAGGFRGHRWTVMGRSRCCIYCCVLRASDRLLRWRCTAVRCLTKPCGLTAGEDGLGVARSAAASGDTLGDVAADVEVELDGQVGLAECLPGMAESF